MVARGLRLFKNLKKLKMKMRQHNTDEAGDYGNDRTCEIRASRKMT